ncbi:penicillin acylase family protein [Gemmatimonas sp.]|uniref:penicillin acylase family protein n=1 Tax=Gemmatimonas sp. TaxID=1962908 RepID=UPI00286E444A|nr:penicillin acylase family protein [Gemmatimonas sp.]
MTRGRLITAALCAAVGIGTTYVGVAGAGPLPPLGGLLSPAVGLWANAVDDLPAEATSRIPSLDGTVDVRYDSRSVPHIFATTDADAMRALGYVTARDRLFQLEIQSRAGEGTLTELVGEVALPADQETRRLGMPRSAERKWRDIGERTPSGKLLLAYAEGVNAYRTSLSPAQWPVEYKLLNRAPREWVPLHSVHVLNRMGYTLARGPGELELLEARALVGNAAANALMEENSAVQEPIQPMNRSAARVALSAIPAPGAPDSLAARMVASLRTNASANANAPGMSPLSWLKDIDPTVEQARAFASNNWAVAPSRSANGHALLAGDPHLELTLPSIWYEVHIVVPGSFEIGGVSIPGLPGVPIGYSRAVAWSATNTGADVMDFWREKVNNDAAPTAYELDGVMTTFTDTRIESYRDKAGRVIDVDTIYYTHRGPMQRQGREWLSMRWTVLESGKELQGYFAAFHATTAPAFLDSMAQYYHAPAQNFITADTSGTIMIRSTGRYPVRADSGRGTEVRDGRLARNDWIGDWPVARYPQGRNPAQGYLASANQQPIDPQQDALYLGPDPNFEIWRALQINRLLRADSTVTADEMRSFHTNPGSVRADLLVSALVSAAQARIAAGDNSASLKSAESLLASWNRQYTRDNTGARLFETAIAQTTALLYDEFIPAKSDTRAVTPSESRLLQLIADSANGWWDDRRTTNVREDRNVILAKALRAAYDTLVAEYGDPATTPWTWGRVAPAKPNHLLRLPGFAAPEMPIDGGRGTLNPSVGSKRANFGASWRMVVEMDKEPRIRAVYPGGQSGNPASTRYLDRYAMWANGQLDSVRTPRSAKDLAALDTRAVLTLTR